MARLADPNKQAGILRAARTVFARLGYSDTRIGDIAQAAGIAPGTFYRYFPSKEAVAEELCEDYLTRLAISVAPAMQNPDPAAAIAQSVHLALDYARQERDLVRLLGLRDSLTNRAEMLPAEQRLHEMLKESLAQRMDRGDLVCYNPAALADLIARLIEWVCTRMLSDEADLPVYEVTCIQMIQHALLPAGEAGEPTPPAKTEEDVRHDSFVSGDPSADHARNNGR